MFPLLLRNFKSYMIKYDTKYLPYISYVRYSLGIVADGGTEREDAATLENERSFCFISHLLQECSNGEKFKIRKYIDVNIQQDQTNQLKTVLW